MMKDPKTAPRGSLSENAGLIENENDPSYFYGPNAFINVIDIMREQVIAQIRINPGCRNIPHLSTYFTSNSKSYSRGHKTLSLSKSRHVPQRSRQSGISNKNGKYTITRKQFGLEHKIATMYYDEPMHELYIGYSDGEVECFVPMSLN